MSKSPTLLVTPRGLDLHRPDAPRWLATPALRKQGWQSTALKRPAGDYMSLGEAIDAATKINQMIEDYRLGIPPRGPWAHLAPRHVAQPFTPRNERTIGALLDQFMQSDRFRSLSQSSQRNYRTFLGRFLDIATDNAYGDPTRLKLPPKLKAERKARYDAQIAAFRAFDINDLLEDGYFQDLYNKARRVTNPDTDQPLSHMANAMITHTRAWLQWVIDKVRHNGQRVLFINPAADVDTIESPGRINPWPQTAIDRFVAMALEMGWVSIAHATLMAIELSWSQKDILPLTHGQFKRGTAYDEAGNPYPVIRADNARSKTDVRTMTTLTHEGEDLLAAITAHWRKTNGYGENVDPSPDTPLFVVDALKDRDNHGAVGKLWNADYFRHIFADIRAACSPPITHTFGDLRDTAFTIATEKGLDTSMIRSRTQHASDASTLRMGAKHYGSVTLTTSDAAARKLSKQGPKASH